MQQFYSLVGQWLSRSGTITHTNHVNALMFLQNCRSRACYINVM
uniref:Uncharacterized protein n=1 Tax=Anguilla anguilla TaxID=7936 RepID=A0A0E9PWQ8_ANGAN